MTDLRRDAAVWVGNEATARLGSAERHDLVQHHERGCCLPLLPFYFFPSLLSPYRRLLSPSSLPSQLPVSPPPPPPLLPLYLSNFLPFDFFIELPTSLNFFLHTFPLCLPDSSLPFSSFHPPYHLTYLPSLLYPSPLPFSCSYPPYSPFHLPRFPAHLYLLITCLCKV